MDSQSLIQDLINFIRTAIRDRSVTNTIEARVLQYLLDMVNEVGEALSLETNSRQSSVAALENRLQNTADALRDIMKGAGVEASAHLYPFLDLGNVTSQQEVNTVLNSVYASTDLKYNGQLRIRRNGAPIVISQHIVNANDFYWAQAAWGKVAPSEDGQTLEQAETWGIVWRTKNYLGVDTGWKSLGGTADIELKTINGQSIKGTGNIEISAGGQIDIDDIVNPNSGNAVSGRAVAAAIGELVTSLQSIVQAAVEAKKAVAGFEGFVDDMPVPLPGGDSIHAQAVFVTSQNRFYGHNGSAYYEEWYGSENYRGTNGYPLADRLYFDTDTELYYGFFGGHLTRIDYDADERLAALEGKNYHSMARFASIVETSRVNEQSYEGSDGDVVYVSNLGTFAYRVLQLPSGFEYYRNWTGSEPYFNAGHTAPSEDVLYILEGETPKLYVWSDKMGALLTPQGSDADISELERDVASNTTAISGLDTRVTAIEREGVPSTVTADEGTITTKNAQGTDVNIVRLADKAVTQARSVGTTHVTGNALPSGADTAEGMRYLLYDNITAGNATVDGVSVLKLGAGSKLVPNGGVPQLPVVGGETSWVHSSDIGMVQDDGTHNSTVAEDNAAILRKLLTTRYNLILDGVYCIKVSNDTEVNQSDNIQVDREFHISGGGFNIVNGLFTVVAGGALYAENTVFRKVGGGYYSVFVRPFVMQNGTAVAAGEIDALEFVNCTFIDTTRFFNESIAKRVISQEMIDRTAQAAEGDYYKYVPWHTGYIPYVTSYKRYDFSPYGNSIDTGYAIFTFDNRVECDAFEVRLKSTGAVVSQSDYYKYALERHSLSDIMFVPDDNGEYIFVVTAAQSAINNETQTIISLPNGVDSYTKYGGYHKKLSDATESEISSAIDGGNRRFAPVSWNGLLLDIVNPEKELAFAAGHYGVRSLRFINCDFNVARVMINDCPFRDKFEILNCRFNDFTTTAVYIASSNGNPFIDYWKNRSASYMFENCEFNGVKRPQASSSYNYSCAILTEGKETIVKNCKISNIIGTIGESYDVYLSTNSVVFENNLVHNVFPAPKRKSTDGTNAPTTANLPSYEWGKSKHFEVVDGVVPSRVFRNNTYEVDYDEAWGICESYLENQFSAAIAAENTTAREIFDTLCMRASLFTPTAKALLNLVMEGNTFRMPQGMLVSKLYSGKTGVFGELTVRNNHFHFNRYFTVAAPYDAQGHLYHRPLFRVYERTSAHPSYDDYPINVTFDGNTFRSNVTCDLKLFGTDKHVILNKVHVTNNKFINCDFGFYNYDLSNGRTQVSANELIVKGNSYSFSGGVPYVRHSVSTGPIDGTADGKHGVPGDMFRYSVRDYAEVEVHDHQADGTETSVPRYIDVVQCDGGFSLKSKFIKRTMDDAHTYPQNGDNPIVLNWNGGNYLSEDAGRMVSTKYWRYDGSINACVPGNAYGCYGKGIGNCVYGVDVSYTHKGERKTRHMEIFHCQRSIARREVETSVPYNNVYYKTVVRDFDGRIVYNPANNIYASIPISSIDEIGLKLKMDVNILSNDAYAEDYTSDGSRCRGKLRLYVYSEEGGTRNDKDTDIEISVCKINAGAIYYSGSPNLANFTPVSKFLPKGAAVDSAWMDAMNSAITSTATQKFLRAEDVGMRVYADGSWHTWNGTAWVKDTKVVRLTQAQYDALTVKDADTLYIIINE